MHHDDTHLPELVHEWYRAWNAHDLDAILRHYAPSVVFTSPGVARLGFDPRGTVTGLDALARYFEAALARTPDLRFEPLDVLTGISGITLLYRNQVGRTAAETMLLDGSLVARAIVHYSPSKA